MLYQPVQRRVTPPAGQHNMDGTHAPHQALALPAGYLAYHGIAQTESAASSSRVVARRTADDTAAHDQSGGASRPEAPDPHDPTIGASDDPVEGEADRIAAKVVAVLHEGSGADKQDHAGGVADQQTQAFDVALGETETLIQTMLGTRQSQGGATAGKSCACGTCPDCQQTDQQTGASAEVRRKVDPGAALGGVSTRRLGTARGQTMTTPERMVRAFAQVIGRDVSSAVIVVGGEVDAQAHRIRARAFTVGNRVFVRSDAYVPGTPEGDLLLAHELVHVVLGHAGAAAGGTLRRFERSERAQITNLEAVLDTAHTIAREHGGLGLMRWGRFTAGAGGFGGWEAITKWAGRPASGSTARGLANRYLFTCRCGMVDMRHFYQLMYIALLRGGQKATDMGRDHELNSEATSRFAAEDSPSNALGAYFGTQQSLIERQTTFVNRLREYLQRCNPVDFPTMSGPDQDAVVDYYGVRQADGTPTNQNETATPVVLSVAACGGQDRTMPFTVDPSDSRGKTINGTR